MIRTLGDGVGMAARSLALPWFFGLRWMSQQDRLDPREVPKADFSMGLAAKVAADEFFLATEVVSMTLIAARERRPIGSGAAAGRMACRPAVAAWPTASMSAWLALRVMITVKTAVAIRPPISSTRPARPLSTLPLNS